MSNTELKNYLPLCYKDIIEVEAEQDALSLEADSFKSVSEQAMNDQFIQNCSLKAISYYENIFRIVADPTTENLQFRRDRVLSRMQSLKPPYTYWYLKKILDKFFGVGNYELEVDNDNYIIKLESSSSDALWYHEIQVSLTTIKPCNLVFQLKPNIYNNLITNETIMSTSLARNYKLNGTWLLGFRPFVTEESEEIRKMPDVASIRNYFIQQNIEYWEDLFAKALINNTHTVTNLNITVGQSQLLIEYNVNHESVNTITNIKLQDNEDITLIDSNVFIPVDDYVTIKHIIKLEEGVND